MRDNRLATTRTARPRPTPRAAGRLRPARLVFGGAGVAGAGGESEEGSSSVSGEPQTSSSSASLCLSSSSTASTYLLVIVELLLGAGDLVLADLAVLLSLSSASLALRRMLRMEILRVLAPCAWPP